MQIENKLKIKMENKTRYTRHDIAIMDLVAAFFQETTNKLKNKRNETEEILLLDRSAYIRCVNTHFCTQDISGKWFNKCIWHNGRS